jgi:small GTP-binding protein
MSDLGKYKLVILGEGRVGKTSLLMRYFKKIFNENEKSTVNPAFHEKTENYKGKKYEFKFWDTAGQERYNALNAIYYQNAVGALIVYDVTIPETFKKVKDWVNTLREIVDKNIIFVIAGNKFDLCDKKLKEKNEEIVNDYCQKERCQHFYTSAKTGFSVDDVFECLIKKVLDNIEKNPDIVNKKKGRRLEISAHEDEPKQKKRKCC